MATRLKNAKEMMPVGEMDRSEHKQIASELESDIDTLKGAKLSSISVEDYYQPYFKKGLNLGKDFAIRYKESILERGQQIMGVIFLKKIVYDEYSCRTTTRIPSLK